LQVTCFARSLLCLLFLLSFALLFIKAKAKEKQKVKKGTFAYEVSNF